MSSSLPTRVPVRPGSIPSPRPAEDDTVVVEPVDQESRTEQPVLPTPRHPWPEPWGSFRGASPRSEYWDVATASWRSRGPYPDGRA